MNRILDFLTYRWKAVAAFLAPGALLLAVPMSQGIAPASGDLWQAAGASVAAFFAVYFTVQTPMPNKKPVPADEDLSDLEGEDDEENLAPYDDVDDEIPDPAGDHRAGKPIEG